MNPEWMEWVAENMPADMLEQMISSRNWDLEWRNNQIAELLAGRDRLRNALEMITTYTHSDGQCANGHTPVFVARTALQEDRDE